MKALATILLLSLLGVTKRLTLAREGSVVVKCRQDVVRVQIIGIEHIARSLNATAFLLGDLDGHSCTVDERYATVNLHYPFRMCGTKVMLSGDGVILFNTVWVWTSTGVPIKFADVQCRYGSHFGDTSEPQLISLEERSSGKLRSEVGLCKTPMYCPSHVCPDSESLVGGVIYFERDVMHLSITLTEMETRQSYSEDVGATITRLVLSCGANPLHSARDYYSVLDGCRAGNSFENRRKALYTQVEYNVQSNTVCLSVYTPPSKECSVFYLHGTAIQCNRTYEKRCDDFSGSMCSSPGATKSDFVYGPIYVFDGNLTEAIVSYADGRTDTTKQIYPASHPDEDTLDDTEEMSIIVDQDPNSRSNSQHFDIDNVDIDSHEGAKSNNKGGEQQIFLTPSPAQIVVPPDKPLDFDQIVSSTTSQNTPIVATMKRPHLVENFNPKLTSLNDMIDLEQIAEEKVLNNPIFDIVRSTNANGSESEALGEDDAPRGRGPEILSKPMNSKKPESESNLRHFVSKGQPAVEKVNNVERPIEENASPVTESDYRVEQAILDMIDEGGIFPPSWNESGVERNRKRPTDQEPPVVDLPESSLEKPPLGKYSARAGKDGFIWAAVSALGVFLLASIGLLAAWTATRRRKARRLKSRIF